MDLSSQFIFILLALGLVLLNGFFVNAEFAIVKVRETRIQEMVQQGSRRAEVIQKMLRDLDEYLSATQLGITLASLGLGWIGEPAFAEVFAPLLEKLGITGPALTHTLAAGSAFALITFLHIVLGELAPKSLAIQKPEQSVLLTGPGLSLFYRISYPFIWTLNGAANLLLRMLGFQPTPESELAHSEEELRLLLAHSKEKGVLDREKTRLIEKVFDFGERSVRQVMVPSVEVKYLDITNSLDENMELARKAGHTRYPLCEGSLDRIVGIVHVKDLAWNYKLLGKNFDLQAIQRPVHFVPENKDIKSLLSEFRRSRVHLAVVVDEFGSTIGIVALEDILEELVGEIQDEFDQAIPPQMISSTAAGHYEMSGRTLIGDVEKALGIELDDEENDTIAGHVMMVLGRTAQVGDEVTLALAYRARVVGMKGLQITDLTVERLPESNSGNSGP